MSTTQRQLCVLHTDFLVLLSHRYIFNLIYKIGITSVCSVEIHDYMPNAKQESASPTRHIHAP